MVDVDGSLLLLLSASVVAVAGVYVWSPRPRARVSGVAATIPGALLLPRE